MGTIRPNPKPKTIIKHFHDLKCFIVETITTTEHIERYYNFKKPLDPPVHIVITPIAEK